MASRPELLGRRSECDSLDRVLAGVRAGESQVLVVRGEAGVGKSALLDYLAASASGCRVARAAGVEAEAELPFAGVHQLCAPMLDRMTGLPEPQRDALATAFGLSVGATPDRFLVGLAVLGLLAETAEERPLVCIIDDAQWIDRASTQILAFVARRLLAERVALVLAVREPSDEQHFRSLPAMPLGGLADEDARALLDAALPGGMDEGVRARIVAEARGNPLALLELPRGASAAELAGGFALPHVSLARRIEQSFLARLESLPIGSRRLLLAAAAEPLGDVTLLWRAAGRLGVPFDAAAPAVAAGLIELGARIRFRHPLVRSAIYHAAAPSDRAAVHRALAEATDPDADPDRRAWHRAQAAVAPDESVADELERSADRARIRGGIAAAAAFLDRASQLTPDLPRRAARALAAVQAKLEAGAAEAASALLAVVEAGPLDELQAAQVARLRALIGFSRTRGRDAPGLLLAAARRFEPVDAVLARETYLQAFGAAIVAGRLGGQPGEEEVAEAARLAPPAPGSSRPTDVLLDAVATRFTEGHAAAVAPLSHALLALRQQAARGDEDALRCVWLACPIAPEPLALELWDDESWNELAIAAVQLARSGGALAILPMALRYRAGLHVHTGELAAAAALVEEADAITEATGSARVWHTAMLLAAWRGDEAEVTRLSGPGIADAVARGEGRVLGFAGYATAVLNNGLCRFADALAGARLGCEDDDFGFYGWTLAELVEAAARAGARGVAADALRQLEDRTRAAGTEWAMGMLARSTALLHDGPAADRLYQEAIARLERSRVALHLARTRLLYGEWLRREDRRVDAREQLRTAHAMLDGFGTAAFAERARRELVATGETVRSRAANARDALTAQEAQVARLAAAGHTNPEIGSQLFISPRTAEYHLHKVFAKLGITSRRELRRSLRDATATARAP